MSPKIRDTFLEVPHNKYQGLYLGPPISGNYHLGLLLLIVAGHVGFGLGLGPKETMVRHALRA